MRFGIRELVFLLVLLAMPGVAYFAVFKEQNNKHQEARAEIATKRATLNDLDKATKQFMNLDEEIVRLKTAIRDIEQKLPADRETHLVLNQVADIARGYNLKVEEIKPDKVVSAGPFASELPIKIQIKGRFDGFYKFMLDVERLPRITQVPVMKLEGAKKKGQDPDGTMVATMTLSIFFENSETTALAR